MKDPGHIAEDYIAAWNETDAAARHAKLSDGWTTTAAYADPVARAEGLTAINDMIAGVQRQFPAFRFALAGAPSGHSEFVRFRWKLGPNGGESPVEGSDVLVMEGGKIGRVIFLDKVPQ